LSGYNNSNTYYTSAEINTIGAIILATGPVFFKDVLKRQSPEEAAAMTICAPGQVA
jgi:hypothetical protein